MLTSTIALPLAAAHSIELTVIPVGLGPETVIEAGVGRLAWRGGLRISSADDRFGGLSDLVVSADGERLTAVSDKGRWFTARLLYDEAGMLRGIEDGWMARLRGPDGNQLEDKAQGDAEAIAESNGSLLVAFERDHRILRYPPGTPPEADTPEPLPMPPEIATAPNNSGIEALTPLANRRLLALTEGQEVGGGLAAFLWADGGWSPVVYGARLGFEPTSAARLPDGDVIVLERRATLFGGLATRLRRIPEAEIRPGALLRGSLLATLRPPIPVENFEGVAARTGGDGVTLLYLLSDDDFSIWRETYLIMLALEG